MFEITEKVSAFNTDMLQSLFSEYDYNHIKHSHVLWNTVNVAVCILDKHMVRYTNTSRHTWLWDCASYTLPSTKPSLILFPGSSKKITWLSCVIYEVYKEFSWEKSLCSWFTFGSKKLLSRTTTMFYWLHRFLALCSQDAVARCVYAGTCWTQIWYLWLV